MSKTASSNNMSEEQQQ
jgi:hypothetical protein